MYDIINKEVLSLAYTDAGKRATMKYAREKLKRVPLDMQLSDYEELKQAAGRAGESVNGYIKQAIKERMERDAATRGGNDGAAPRPGNAPE